MILTHNGKFTIRSTRTGEHRTFRIKTQATDSKFAPGKRVLSLLTGPDNSNDYKGFAFVDENGIHIWRSKQTPVFQAYVAMLLNLDKHIEDEKVELFAETRCRVCNRCLTTPESVQSGIGPICDGRSTDRVGSGPAEAYISPITGNIYTGD